MGTPERTAASTFNRVALDLTHAAFPELAAATRVRTSTILELWRSLSLTAMPHLDWLTLEEFENSIAAILSAAAEAFESADPQQLRAVVEGSPAHGLDRFIQKYSVLDLFEEVRILRGVIIIQLAQEMKRPLEVGEAATFHAVFDLIIQQGVMALVQGHEELAAIVESSNDAIVSTDLDGIITTWNRGASRLFGFAADDMIGRPITLLIPPERLADEAFILGAIGRGESIQHYETVRNHRNGTPLSISLAVSPIHDSRGRITGASEIARDVTDRVAMERRIREQSEALTEESRRKDEFLAILSHELRNPLAPIRAAVQLLRVQEHSGDPVVRREAREVIERQIGNLTRLVNDLLEVSRLATGRICLDRQIVDLNRVIEHAVESAGPLIGQRKHTLTVALASEPVWCDVDATRVEEVFINLLNNAAKYTAEGGRIEIAAERSAEQGWVHVRVRDNGMGIDPKLLPRVFDMFTQADCSLARSAGGLGIGLSLAHKLVTLHGGAIQAHSPPPGRDIGSEFIVRLPLASRSQRPPTPPTADGPVTAEGTRVLVVDDNADTADMLARLLRHEGYTVRSASTGSEALAGALHWRPDVVLMDIGLPEVDGYEVARRLRSGPVPGNSGGRMRLIALTGYGRDRDIARAHEAGFDAHMIKPVDWAQLQSLLRNR